MSSSEFDELPAEAVSRAFLVALAVTLPFLLLFWVQLAHHQMWRDEINAFGISADSGSLRELLLNIRYEGHPWVWYVLLRLIGNIYHGLVALRWLQALIGTAIYVLLGFFSPLRWWEKLLLFGSYFIVFEYTVMARMYGLVLLTMLLYLLRRCRAGSGPIGNALLLGLMANLDLMGILLSLSFALEYLWSLWRPTAMKVTPATFKRVCCAVLLYLACLGLSTYSIRPPDHPGAKKDQGVLLGGVGHSKSEILLNEIVVPYFPTLTGSHGIFWETRAAVHKRFFLAMLPVVLLLYVLVVRRYSNLIVLLTAQLTLNTAFGYLVYDGSPRHWGMNFLAFVGAIWLLRAYGQSVNGAAYVLLSLGVLAGVDATLGSWKRPFSNVETTAHWLQQSGWNKLPLVSSEDFTTLAVATVLQQPIYTLECGCQQRYMQFNAQRDTYDSKDLPVRVLRAEQDLHASRMVLLTVLDIQQPQVQQLLEEGFTITQLHQFVGSEMDRENLRVWLVQRMPNLGTQPG